MTFDFIQEEVDYVINSSIISVTFFFRFTFESSDLIGCHFKEI